MMGPVTATILDGRATLATIVSELSERVAKLTADGRPPASARCWSARSGGSCSDIGERRPRWTTVGSRRYLARLAAAIVPAEPLQRGG